MASIKGRVQAVIYNKQDFYILSFDRGTTLEGGRWMASKDNTKVSGTLCGLTKIQAGLTIELFGDWVTHAKYGKQFSAYGWKPWAHNYSSVETFLSCCPGFLDFGLVELVVGKFGVNSFEALTSTPEKVLELASDRYPKEVFENILVSWAELTAIYDLSLFLKHQDISSAIIKSILAALGPGALEAIKANPYVLLSVEGFTFSKVDGMALKTGITSEDPRRTEGAILWVLRTEEQSGHLFVKRSDLLGLVSNLLKPSEDFNLVQSIQGALRGLLARSSIVMDTDAGIYLPEHYKYERDSAKMLSKFIGPMDLDINLTEFLDDYQKTYNIELSDAQKESVEKLAKNKVFVLTGLPGSGKTTTVKSFIKLFEKAGIKFSLMAPTGIAAKRLATVTGQPAATIHRTFRYDGHSWAYNESCKYTVGAVLLDETSMCDQKLFYHILSALDPSTILVFVGDDAQLPSVGAGNVLRELLSCDAVAHVKLTKVFRQAAHSLIIQNAHRINRGEDIEYTQDNNADFQFIPVSNEDTIVEYIVKIVTKLKAKDAKFQVISPKYEGLVGINNLNLNIREALNPLQDQRECKFGDILHVREGDRVMVVKNNYELNVFNGDMGKLMSIDSKDLVIKIHEGGLESLDAIVRISKDQAATVLKLAYAISCHKSQGLEHDTVIIPIVKSQGRMLQRNLLYTAVTRAKKKLIMLGDPTAVFKSIENNKIIQRNTVLCEAILSAVKDGVTREAEVKDGSS